MREIELIRGNRETSIPKWLIRLIVKEVYGDSLSISAKKKKGAAKRKLTKKAATKK